MQVKRYKAADMRRALELVRSDLGDDAVILSSNNTKKGVEILATADDCQELLDSANTPEPLASESVNVFAKYESAAEQESLAMLDELTAESASLKRELASDSNTPSKAAKSKVADVDKSYLAEQLEKLTSNISFPGKTSPTDRNRQKIQTNTSKGSIEIVEDSDFSQTFDFASKAHTKVKTPKSTQVAPQPAVAAAPADDHSKQHIKQLQSELTDMRELLEMQLAQTRFANLRGMQLVCDRRLEKMGFGLHFRSDFHSACDLSSFEDQDEAWTKTLDYLSQQVNTLRCDLINSGGQIAFVGPTGAGKTTTIAKLATRYVLTHGRESIALITLDNERLGSQGQLKALANILQIPVRSVTKPEDLTDTLASLDYCKLVLIDTPGVTASTVNDDAFVQQLFAQPAITKLAVLACNAQRRFQKSLLEAMSDKNIRAAVLTKLDETDCLAETLDVVVSERLPIAYSTNGQHIPNDLAIANAAELVAEAESVLTQPLRESTSNKAAKEIQKQTA